MRPQAKEVYRLVKELHAQIYQATKELHQEAAECVDMQELADLAFAMRDTYKFLDDMRKVVDQTKKTAERMACLVWIKTESHESIRTEWCTATPNVRMMCKLPHRKRDPEQYAIMMESLGVSPNLYDQLEVVRPHWPGFVEYLTLLAEEGKPLPKGLDPNKQYPIYSLLIRAKKELGTRGE